MEKNWVSSFSREENTYENEGALIDLLERNPLFEFRLMLSNEWSLLIRKSVLAPFIE
jgi:hypothetical protein